ncbi:P27 family phage terminase small subunit [Roseomonas sp. USHLN139]|uniref:P27 family phage terminase small subunit n=1 Tax=Roseomonas sp. USHLN139 TaxID=3081298 RepID=UPI003B021874
MAGRPRKPSHLKLVTGTERKSRANPAEPKPGKAPRLAPPGLPDAVARAWRLYVPRLDRMGVLTEADIPAVLALCYAHAERDAARAALAEPFVIRGTGGGPDVTVAAGGVTTYATMSATGGYMLRTRPEVALVADADRRVMAYLSHFGLTPAARSKVQVTGGDAGPADEADAFFG